jgi:hypothetical protein
MKTGQKCWLPLTMFLMPVSKLVFSHAPRGTSTRVSLLNCTMDTCARTHAEQ